MRHLSFVALWLTASFVLVALFAAPAAAAPPTTFQPQFELTDDAPTEAERLEQTGKKRLYVGIGLAGGGLVGLTIAAIDRAAFSPVCAVYDTDLGHCSLWMYYDQLGYFPGHAVAMVGSILSGAALTIGAILIIDGLLKLREAKEGVADARAVHWRFAWGPPVGLERPLLAPGLVAPGF